MKNNAKKIEKLLEKFDRIFTEYIEKAQREPEKEEKKREKTARKAENICRRALALCREDIANGLPDDGKLLVGCVFRLSDYLIRRGNRDEAEGLLLGNQLIITMETTEKPLNIEDVERILKQFFQE